MNTLITICARAGSKRLPGKNIKEFAGMPLFMWTIIPAFQFLVNNKGCRIIICTDIKEITTNYIQKQGFYNIPVINRPIEISGAETPKMEVIRYATEEAEKHFGQKYDIVIDLDVTSPCRWPSDISNAYKMFLKLGESTLFSVVSARRIPWFNQVIKFSNLYWQQVHSIIKVAMEPPIPQNPDYIAEVFDMNASIYIYNRKWLLKNINHPVCIDSLIYLMENWQGYDIDTQTDWDIAEMLFKKHILKEK